MSNYKQKPNFYTLRFLEVIHKKFTLQTSHLEISKRFWRIDAILYVPKTRVVLISGHLGILIKRVQFYDRLIHIISSRVSG